MLLYQIFVPPPPPVGTPITTTTTIIPTTTVVNVTPSAAGMPGEHLFPTIMGWLAQVALYGSLASILVGAAVWGLSQQAGNYGGVSKGRTFALAGVAGAVLTGLAPTIVNLLYRAAQG